MFLYHGTFFTDGWFCIGHPVYTLYKWWVHYFYKKLLGQDIWDKKLAHIFLPMPKKKNLFPTIYFCLKWFVFWAGSGQVLTRPEETSSFSTTMPKKENLYPTIYFCLIWLGIRARSGLGLRGNNLARLNPRPVWNWLFVRILHRQEEKSFYRKL